MFLIQMDNIKRATSATWKWLCSLFHVSRKENSVLFNKNVVTHVFFFTLFGSEENRIFFMGWEEVFLFYVRREICCLFVFLFGIKF